MLKINALKFYLSLVIVLTALYGGFIAAPTLQAQFTCSAPIQLSSGLTDSLYDLDNNLVVWVEDDDGDGEIWLYDLSTQTHTRLTDNTTHEDGFAVKNNVVVLSINTPKGDEIFLYDPISKTQKKITDNTVEEMGLYTDGTSVVWYAESTTYGNEIYHYNIATGVTKRLTNNDVDDFEPRVSGNFVLWTSYNGYDSEVFKYDLVLGKQTQISNIPFGDSSLQDVDGSRVVWVSYDAVDEDTEIYYYNLDTRDTLRLTDDQSYDEKPVIDGRYIAWEAFDGTDSEIMLYDIENNDFTTITDNSYDDTNVSIHNNVLVWEGYDGNNFEIFSHDLTDNTQNKVASNKDWDNKPIIHSQFVVWQSGIFFHPQWGEVAELLLSDCRGSIVLPTEEPTDEPTSTQAPLPQPTPTDEPVLPRELVANPSFEEQDVSGRSTAWKVKNGSRDKLRCNKPEKLFAFSGECAFVFKGGAKEQSKLMQEIGLEGKVFHVGDTLELSLKINAAPQSNGKIKLRVVYSDGTATGKITERFNATDGYVEMRYPHTLESGSITSMKVIVQNKSVKGKVLIDDISLKHTENGTRSGLVPLP